MFRQKEGISRDLSEQGAFIFTMDCPPVGSTVDLKIILEALRNVGTSLPLEFQGQVLRVERFEGTCGFAVSRTSS
jgi:hypothetical protein